MIPGLRSLRSLTRGYYLPRLRRSLSADELNICTRHTRGVILQSMSTTVIDEAKLKEALKAALIEILEERKDLVREVLEEALEDIALARAIEEGEQSELVTRDEVFNALERNN